VTRLIAIIALSNTYATSTTTEKTSSSAKTTARLRIGKLIALIRVLADFRRKLACALCTGTVELTPFPVLISGVRRLL
jgi:hypothetical protein